ncbi:outer membrane receptor protein involved in Fe transport [Algoriphagus ratkowskyi]|uniref:Outer membrane receptor protein involved in Fe transport n=1 Tax=Algoriphagus ratkowskyi TaxID=57028 RepID=A0A2W7STB7_9BACT|nr:outer membrane beta-barrel family protein [Algoriphagus ratkowskyi]PZX53942.1 outer membrane receptor protein involved in Fe transport [Algoriphagus ratkowskyi]TXD76658.1 TonB-dependent receptor [Algoriphagus ratkowskyi]
MKFKTFFLITFFASHAVFGQETNVKLSGKITNKASQEALSYVNIVLRTSVDSTFVTGAISDEAGLFTLSDVPPGNYELEASFIGFETVRKEVYVGSSSPFLNIGEVALSASFQELGTVEVIGQLEEVSAKMDKKTYDLGQNISQSGGSVLQAMSNLPGVTVQEGKVQIRGNDRIAVLIDGKQTALTGFGNQTGLDNLPSSAVERIEIINNPSAKFDANGNGGIINIILKKEKQEGFNGKVGLAIGVGALWEKQANLPGIRTQYQGTPKINPSLSLNYRKKDVNFFFSADNLYTETLNKNEYITRNYDDGTVIHQQLKRNRNTNFLTTRAGMDWTIDSQNTLTISGLFGSEKIIDRGDQPFYNGDFSERLRLWQFLEDELKTTVMATVAIKHNFIDPGRSLSAGLNYTFHREDEQYFFTNTLPEYTGEEAFKLLSDENVVDVTLDYVQPLKNGRLETGMKFRSRWIPTNMQFFPSENSPIDSLAGGAATYKEIIPAVYGNYVFESKKWDAEIGLRLEYFKLNYDVNPNHPTYKSDGNTYFQPFPNTRVSYKLNELNKLTVSYNRRVDRPNEVDIRIFPKYDDAEIIKVGNPALKPQFTNSFELGWKTTWSSGSLYLAIYHRSVDGTITRISTTFGDNKLIYAIFQNAGKSYNSGFEIIWDQDVNDWYSFDLNLNGYHNQIDAFTVENLYPEAHTLTIDKQEIFSGNAKWNSKFRFSENFTGQLSAIYLAKDIIPQGVIQARFTLDMGIKKVIQNGNGELYFNATDLLNTMVIKKNIDGSDFSYTSADYYETQVFRLGYNYKF